MRLALCVFLVAASAFPEEAPRVSATTSKTEVTVGEAFIVDVSTEGPPGTVFTFPEGPGTDEVELRTPPVASESPPPLTEGRHRYEAVVFALGETAVPPITVGYRLADGGEGTVRTEPIPVRVLSLLPKDPEQRKLADIRGPLPLSIGRAFWVGLGATLVLLAGLVLWWRRRRRAPTAVAPREPEVPPDAEAILALDSLAASGLAGSGDFRGYYIALAGIAKRYLERRLEAPVLEMTTAEMVAFLRDGPHRELLPVVKDLAGAADQIKFARGEGLTSEAGRHLQAVRGLVQALEARLRPPAERAA